MNLKRFLPSAWFDSAKPAATSTLIVEHSQDATRWILPFLSGMTPTYVDSVLRNALAGHASAQYELFDLMMDTCPELSACIQEFVDLMYAKNFSVEPYTEQDAEASSSAADRARVVNAALRNMRGEPGTVDEIGLKDLMREILFARWIGLTVTEIVWENEDGTPHEVFVDGIGNVRAPRCARRLSHNAFKLVDGKVQIRVKGQGGQSEYVPASDGFQFLISRYNCKSGPFNGGAMFRQLAWCWCAANFSQDWMLSRAELFGIPFRHAELSNSAWQDVNLRAAIAAAMQNMGPKGYGITPEGCRLNFLEAAQSGQSPQSYMVEFAHRMMRSLILGQTMSGGAGTTGKGGGQAFGSVEADQKTLRIQAGADFVCDTMRQLSEAIIRLNYADADEIPVIKMQSQEDVRSKVEAFGVAVRAGVLTPSETDEESLRKQLSLPPMSDDVLAEWERIGGTRTPITLQQETVGEEPAEPVEKDEKNAPAEAMHAAQAQAERRLAIAMARDVAPIQRRLKAILAIENEDVMKAKLAKFLEEFPQLKRSVLADPDIVEVMRETITRKLSQGLTSSK